MNSKTSFRANTKSKLGMLFLLFMATCTHCEATTKGEESSSLPDNKAWPHAMYVNQNERNSSIGELNKHIKEALNDLGKAYNGPILPNPQTQADPLNELSKIVALYRKIMQSLLKGYKGQNDTEILAYFKRQNKQYCKALLGTHNEMLQQMIPKVYAKLENNQKKEFLRYLELTNNILAKKKLGAVREGFMELARNADWEIQFAIIISYYASLDIQNNQNVSLFKTWLAKWKREKSPSKDDKKRGLYCVLGAIACLALAYGLGKSMNFSHEKAKEGTLHTRKRATSDAHKNSSSHVKNNTTTGTNPNPNRYPIGIIGLLLLLAVLLLLAFFLAKKRK